MSTATIANIAFQLKGGLFPLTTLQVFSTDLEQLKVELEEKIRQAPNFFNYAPLVIDIKIATQPNNELDFSKLKSLLQELHLIPVGIKNATADQSKIAQSCGLAILRDAPNPREKEKLSTAPQVTAKPVSSKVITEPVRSGQQIYAPDGDLIVINHVSPGAELLADGNIHIYGALRGRALAGVNGNQEARIFCQSLEAELISIAGNYKISEDIERTAWKIATQTFIKDERLQICEL